MHFFSLSKSMLNVLFIFVRYQKFHKSMCHQWFSWLEPLISCFIPFHPFYLSHHRYSLSSRGEDVWTVWEPGSMWLKNEVFQVGHGTLISYAPGKALCMTGNPACIWYEEGGVGHWSTKKWTALHSCSAHPQGGRGRTWTLSFLRSV
jgi:hypothetical protein